jgi:hypothetical protein
LAEVGGQPMTPQDLLELGGMSDSCDGLSWCVGGDGLIADEVRSPSLLDLGGVPASETGLPWCVGGDGLVADFGTEQ